MKRLINLSLLILLFPVLSFTQTFARVVGIDTTVPIHFADETTALPATGKTPANAVIEIWQPHFNAAEDETIINYVTNGTFATDTVWIKNTGWTITGGVGRATSASSDIEQNIACVENFWYRVQYTISGYSTGTVTAKLGGVSGTARNNNGTYTENFRCGSTGLLEFTAASATLDIDDVTVYPGVVTFSPTALGGGVNDLFEIGAQAGYRLELTAENIPAIGTYTISAKFPDTLLSRVSLEVIEENSYNSRFAGVGATLDDIADAILEELVTDHSSVTDSLAAYANNILTALITDGVLISQQQRFRTIQAGTAGQFFPVKFASAGGTPVLNLLDIVCNYSIDASAFTSILDTTGAEIGAGWYRYSLDITEVTGKDLIISCTSATATAQGAQPWEVAVILEN